MTRLSTGNIQYVKPTNNVYTVLVAIALVAMIIGLIVLIVTANSLFKATGQTGAGLFG